MLAKCKELKLLRHGYSLLLVKQIKEHLLAGQPIQSYETNLDLHPIRPWRNTEDSSKQQTMLLWSLLPKVSLGRVPTSSPHYFIHSFSRATDRAPQPSQLQSFAAVPTFQVFASKSLPHGPHTTGSILYCFSYPHPELVIGLGFSTRTWHSPPIWSTLLSFNVLLKLSCYAQEG